MFSERRSELKRRLEIIEQLQNSDNSDQSDIYEHQQSPELAVVDDAGSETAGVGPRCHIPTPSFGRPWRAVGWAACVIVCVRVWLGMRTCSNGACK